MQLIRFIGPLSLRSRFGAMVRTIVFHQCSPGLIPAMTIFEIMCTITLRIVRHKAQLLINHNYNKIREECDSGINYMTG